MLRSHHKLALMLFSALLIALTSIGAQAQRKISDLPFVAKEGQQFTVKIKTVEKKTAQGEVTEHSSRTSINDGQIVKADPDRYLISWTGKSLDWEIFADKQRAAAMKARVSREVDDAFKNIAIVFETDATGTPVLIRDWHAMSRKLTAVMRDGLNNALQERFANVAGKSKEEMDTIIKTQVDQILQTMILRHDERTAIILFEEAALIGSAQHRSWQLGIPSEDTSLAPSLLSDANVPRKSKVTLKRHDKAKDEAEVTWSNTYDPAVLRAFAWDVTVAQLKTAKLDSEKIDAFKKVFDKSNFTRTDGGRAIISIRDGWVRHIEINVHTAGEVPGQPKVEELKSKVVEIAKKN
ncbi:MAG: hypothetical protein ACKVP3_26995 [Hyphomicrobiaceae bacterium]